MNADLHAHDRRRNRPQRPLTDRQATVLWFYQDFTRRHGYSPTIREAMEALGIASTNGVADHLKSLQRKGYIARRLNKQRAVMVLRNPNGSPVECCPTCRRPT
jgi:SOS-response transcriptional repressor LexA